MFHRLHKWRSAAQRRSRNSFALEEIRRRTDDEVDESLEESFPASDPPAWVAVARIGPPKRDREE
jgi:hypothetical protein